LLTLLLHNSFKDLKLGCPKTFLSAALFLCTDSTLELEVGKPPFYKKLGAPFFFIDLCSYYSYFFTSAMTAPIFDVKLVVLRIVDC